MSKLSLVLDVLGAVSVIAGTLGAILPESRAQRACQHLGLGLGRAVGAMRSPSPAPPKGQP